MKKDRADRTNEPEKLIFSHDEKTPLRPIRAISRSPHPDRSYFISVQVCI